MPLHVEAAPLHAEVMPLHAKVMLLHPIAMLLLRTRIIPVALYTFFFEGVDGFLILKFFVALACPVLTHPFFLLKVQTLTK